MSMRFKRRRAPVRVPAGPGRGIAPWAFVLLLAAALALPGAPVAADPQSDARTAERRVEQIAGRVQEILQDPSRDTLARRAALSDLLRDGLDLRTIGDFVLGRYADQLDDVAEARFRDAFSDYVVRTYARLLARQSIDAVVVTGARAIGPYTAAVSTRIRRGEDRSASWTWRLHRDGGTYRVVDLQTAGVSLAVSYRSAFGRRLADAGLDAVVADLRDPAAAPMRFERLALLRLLRGLASDRLALTGQ
jgi:phospholipid transport system substrate-binding protein